MPELQRDKGIESDTSFGKKAQVSQLGEVAGPFTLGLISARRRQHATAPEERRRRGLYQTVEFEDGLAFEWPERRKY
ncbi:MAG TPA: hypothetical protein VMS64_07900 [Candidatus Methylomirabilis sp.]|nr:hypothetical protein [Candidatus Methylomirabilis sp.]